MRNLAIYSHVDRHVDQIDTVQHVCVNSLENTVYMYDDGIVYCVSQEDEHALEKFSVKEHCNEELKSKVVAMSYNSVLGVLCLATEAGDLISLAWTTRQVEVVGSVEQGLRCMQWSPEEEVLLLVTGQNVVMAMTLEFDPLWEQPLHQAAFGEQAFVTVGWGSKQTQFHGSEGKAAAKQTPAISEKPSPRDDGSVRASWRGDGSLVAISAVKPETNARCIRIFSREGVLQATSESVPGLEMALAWRPSGNLIASTQVLPNKYKVIFFEKNGLHHGEFTLPFPPGEGIVRELSWNVQSDILSVWYENIDGAHLLLCSMGNYHWYVKQRFSFSTKQQLLACTWDPEANLRLHVVYGSLQYATYEWNWLINHSSAFAQINRAEVAVIDANDVLLTPFSEKVVPPPMCAERLQLPTNVNQVVLGLPSCPDNVCVVLSDGRLAFFQGPNRSLRWVRNVHVPMENQGRPLLLHHWVWALDQVLLCVATVGLTSHLVWLHLEQEENEVLKAGILEVPLDGSILTLTPVGDGSLGRLVLQMASGGLLLLQLEQSGQLSCSVKPLACCPERLLQVHVLQICDSRPPCIVGLSGRSRLYVDGREVANNVTSMLVLPPDCLLLTTSAHTLLCLQLHFHDQEDAVSCTLSEAVSRRVERGSRLVVATGDRVVLQMPRGNLETITPRALVLKQAAYNLDRGNFAVVFELFRKQRINLNLLVDHNPALFLQHTEEFVRDIKNPAWLSLLAVELSEEDTTKTAYADVYRGQPRPEELPWAEGGKRAAVCTRLCEAMDADGSAALFLPRLTALAVGLRDPGAALAAVRAVGCAELEDLIHLAGPLTEDAVLKCLHARFCASHCFTNVGPILLSVNPYNDVGNPLTLTSTRGIALNPKLLRVVNEAVRQQSETGYPQAIILSGTSGSGKTYASMLLLRQLFDVAGGGPETDAFKHLAAAFTVLRSLGSAKTATNSESSRIGHFIEVQVTDGALYRTKIHCYFLDQTRVIRPLHNEKNYHIFYQMLAGLTPEERAKLSLEGYSPHNLHYLMCGDTRQDEAEDAARFQAWKACLGVLGIPFLDVVRVLAAVLLLGNVHFVDGQGLEVDVKGETELKAVASLLGVSGVALFRGLTSRTHNARGQLIKSVCDANMSNMTRDSLAKALYCRTVATIVRRANSLKRLGSTLGTLSSDSNESVHNQAELASQHASTIGTAGSKSSKSMAALNNAVRHATDGFIGILDMFGFEDPKPSQLEHLCINLCAETMQHFYNTHIFKSSIESCRDEGIHCEVEVDYVDNVPCIDLISSLRTGLLSMLDVECSIRGTAESYIAKVKVQHKQNPRLFEPKPLEPRTFGIQHFAGRVVYDASDFLDTNKDVVPDDLVAVFHKHSCNFGFATHLFGTELKALYSLDTVPRGVSFRISPTSHTDLLNGDEPVSTLTQDFHTRLDNLLRTLVHARPHFVRCLRSNSVEVPGRFDRGTVMRQIRSLQVLETVNLMAGGYPHRMRFKAFNLRYRLLAPFHQLRRTDDKVMDDCQLILQCLQHAMEEQPKLQPSVSTSWALGKRHIFLSEGARQLLETLRGDTRHNAAVRVQAIWRAWRVRRRWPVLRRTLELQQTATTVVQRPGVVGVTSAVAAAAVAGATGTGARPRPQPIAGTPPPDPNEKCDQKMIQQTCTLFGLDLERPPPVPPSRPYTVAGNTKLGYPQTRVMKMPFPEDANGEVVLLKGDTVLVVGASQRRGHLVVEHNNMSLHVPFQFLELKPLGVSI